MAENFYNIFNNANDKLKNFASDVKKGATTGKGVVKNIAKRGVANTALAVLQLASAKQDYDKLKSMGRSPQYIRDVLLRQYTPQIAGQILGEGLGVASKVGGQMLQAVPNPVAKVGGKVLQTVSPAIMPLTTMAGYNMGKKLSEDYTRKTYPDLYRNQPVQQSTQAVPKQQIVQPKTSTPSKPTNINNQKLQDIGNAPKGSIGDFIISQVANNGLERDRQNFGGVNLTPAQMAEFSPSSLPVIESPINNGVNNMPQQIQPQLAQVQPIQDLAQTVTSSFNNALIPANYPQYNMDIDKLNRYFDTLNFNRMMSNIGSQNRQEMLNPADVYGQIYSQQVNNQLGMPLEMLNQQNQLNTSKVKAIYDVLNDSAKTDIDRQKAMTELYKISTGNQLDAQKIEQLYKALENQFNIAKLKAGTDIKTEEMKLNDPYRQAQSLGNFLSGASFLTPMLNGNPQQVANQLQMLQTLGLPIDSNVINKLLQARQAQSAQVQRQSANVENPLVTIFKNFTGGK